MKKTKIKSNKNVPNIPWFIFEFDEKDLAVTFTEIQPFNNIPMEFFEHYLLQKTINLELDEENIDEEHVLAIGNDGQLEFVPTTKQKHEYFAHLVWYNPVKNEATVLEFVSE